MVVSVGGIATPAHAAVIVPNVVTDDNADNGNCTLREAILTANTGAVEDACVQGAAGTVDTILLPPGTYTLSLTGSEDDAGAVRDLDITDDLVLGSQGGTAQDTIVRAGTTSGPAGDGIGRVFDIHAPDVVSISDVTISNGRTVDGFAGTGIRTAGTTTLEDVIVRDGYGGGGGISGAGTAGSLTIRRSAIVSNQDAFGFRGGGLRLTSGTIVIQNSTISGNSSTTDGGGLYGNANVTLDGVTVSNNTANADDSETASGGGILNETGSTINLQGTIIADNGLGTGGSDPDCAGTILSGGSNVVEDPTGCTGLTGTGDLTGQDPQLQPLGLNAPGTTPSQALAPGSIAADHWPSVACSAALVVDEDQRGVPRPQGSACDSGAFEIEVPVVPGMCKGKQATLTGTAQAETLAGTPGNDVIAALGGNDTVKAGKGKDLVCGGDGNDKLNGSGGNDKLLGEAGNDKLKGGGGKDKMVGASGTDKCAGGGGEADKARKCEKTPSVP